MPKRAVKHLKQGTFLKAISKRKLFYNTRIYLRDNKNILKYGFSAPRFAERIWVNSYNCNESLIWHKRSRSGKVIELIWPTE